jgi:hypothetical protein
MAHHDGEIEKLSRKLELLELRLGKLESALSVTDSKNLYETEEVIQSVSLPRNPQIPEEEEKGFESQVGRFGLAWLGNIVLLFGIAFLTEYLISLGQGYISILIGFISAGSIYYLATWLKKTNSHLSFIFKLNSQILLYYVTLRLHFFSVTPVLADKTISIIILLLIATLQIYLGIRNRSQSFATLSVLFVVATAIVSDTTVVILPLLILASALSIYYYYRYNWGPLLVLTLMLAYISFFMWIFGNPLMGHPMQLISEQHSGVAALFVIGTFFSTLLLFRKKDGSSDDFLTGVAIINGIIFTILLLLVVLRFFSTGYVMLFAVITACCLIYSTILHSKSDWNFASAFYALYGFMAMSISLYGLYGFPGVYLLLSVQSLLVVSMALWFRNKLIVVMNSLLFLVILAVYLLSSESVDGVNFSFALIALISARIINWKRSRLQIETDLIRNLYMIEGFFMVLFAMLHAVPKQFVTLSWTIAALLYFLVSIILKNVKYRYMALGTMICAALYLFIVDLARIEIIFRVLALLSLAAISIGISIYYTNRIKKPGS